MRILLTALVALFAGFAGAAAWQYSGLGSEQLRGDLIGEPDWLPQAMDEYQRQQMAARIEPYADELATAFPGAVLGNPNGTVTLVEFSDYACGYCRQSLPDVNGLIAENPDLKVVVREYPILSQGSADAARMALAAAQQGKFIQFHNAMFAAETLSEEAIAAAASAAGLDLDLARQQIASGAYESELQNNVFMAREIGFTGTPSWIIGERAINGAVGREELARAIVEARES